ncbi:hypothetical protein L0Y65_01610 [Candidatus Micrarchaeota archaeon]|nr:hypothetical protein [Candidatus Micrarchaeota archaeon]
MKFLAFIAAFVPLLVLIGCISFGERMGNGTGNESANTTVPPAGNVTENQTGNATQNDTNQTPPIPPPKLYERYMAKGFSFEYPINMSVQESRGSYGGIFTGTHQFDGQTGEMLVVSFVNTTSVFGPNREAILRNNPTKAASDFLQEDEVSDPAGSFLSSAYDVGELSNFGVARDGFVAEAPFKIRFSEGGKSYTGYAMDIYVPERSLLAKVRIIALDSGKAEDIRDNFLLSLRIESP